MPVSVRLTDWRTSGLKDMVPAQKKTCGNDRKYKKGSLMATDIQKDVPLDDKDRALKRVRRLRTQVPKIALPILIIEEMLRGKNPFQYCRPT